MSKVQVNLHSAENPQPFSRNNKLGTIFRMPLRTQMPILSDDLSSHEFLITQFNLQSPHQIHSLHSSSGSPVRSERLP